MNIECINHNAYRELKQLGWTIFSNLDVNIKSELLGDTIKTEIEFEGKVRDFTLDFLKNYYPLYYDSAQNGIKVFAKIIQTEKNIEQSYKKLEQSKKNLEVINKEIEEKKKQIEELEKK